MRKDSVFQSVDNLKPLCQEICRELWRQPETGGNETFAAGYLREILSKEGFVIINEEHLEHAFYAEYGSGSPVIAILGEYDALPMLSQKVCAVKDPIVPGGPGHGCGHNLLGAASATAAIAVKRFLEEEKISGTVRFYGCPEEELLSGKVKMVYYHMFDGCDMAISWHPASASMVTDGGYLANASAKFYFKGISSHAAFAPERGRSALDAVELMDVGVNYLREHVIDKARIHYTTNSGGFAPNIVPNAADSWYYVRAPYMEDVKEILERIRKISEGAALMTETQTSMKVDYGCCEMREHHSFADLAYENLIAAETPEYTPQEEAFAKALQDSMDPDSVKREKKLYGEDEVMFRGVAPREQWIRTPLTASSDSGDISQIMPLCLIQAACWPLGCAPHTWQTSAAAGSTFGEKGALFAAKAIAGTAVDLFTKPEVAGKIQKEFQENDPGDYVPMYGE